MATKVFSFFKNEVPIQLFHYKPVYYYIEIKEWAVKLLYDLYHLQSEGFFRCVEDPLVAFTCYLLLGCFRFVSLTHSPFAFSILSLFKMSNIWNMYIFKATASYQELFKKACLIVDCLFTCKDSYHNQQGSLTACCIPAPCFGMHLGTNSPYWHNTGHRNLVNRNIAVVKAVVVMVD